MMMISVGATVWNMRKLAFHPDGWFRLADWLLLTAKCFSILWILKAILLSVKVSLARETIIPRTLETLGDTGNLFC